MYQYVSSLGLLKTDTPQWLGVDITNTPLNELFLKYQKLYTTLKIVETSNNIHIDMAQFEKDFKYSTRRMSELLAVIEDTTLVTIPTLPTATLRYAQSAELFSAGYAVHEYKAGVGNQEALSTTEKKDLKITRPDTDTDISRLPTECLLAVNGLLHRLITDGTNTYALDAAKSARGTDRFTASLIGLTKLGRISTSPLNLSWKEVPDYDLLDRVHIEIPASMVGKSLMLSLGGYLVTQTSEVFYPLSPNLYCLKVSMLPLEERFLESRKLLDIPGYPTEGGVNRSSLRSNDFVEKYLGVSQSFIIAVDTVNLFSFKTSIPPSRVFGLYTTYQEPKSPLLSTTGRLVDYIKERRDGLWNIFVPQGYLNKPVDLDSRAVVRTNQLKSTALDTLDQPSFLQLGTW